MNMIESFLFLPNGAVNPVSLLVLVLATVYIVRAYWRVDTWIEKRRKKAIPCVAVMAREGLDTFSPFFECYAVGDKSGAWTALKNIFQTLTTPALFKEFLKNLWIDQLKQASSDQERREMIREVFAEQGFAVTLTEIEKPE